jgi:PAS domain S-box-containing protein
MKHDPVFIFQDEPALTLGLRSLRQINALLSRPFAWRAGATLLILAAALGCRLASIHILGDRAVYILFYPAIVAASLLCNFGAGLSVVAAVAVLVHVPFGSLQIKAFHEPGDAVALTAFVFFGFILTVMGCLVRDLARARSRSEELLRINAEQLGNFVEQAPVAMAMFDSDMRYLAASGRWREDFGLMRDVVGKSHYDTSPDIPDRWKIIHSQALAGETIRNDEDRFFRPDGKMLWLRWEVRPWRDARGGIGGVLIFSEDVSERIRAREAAQDSAARLRFALRSANAGVWEWNPGTALAQWSDETWRLFGLQPNGREPSYALWQETVDPDDRARVTQAVQTLTRSGQETEAEWRTADSDGESRWLMSRGGPLPATDSASPRFMGLVLDITDRKRSEQALRDNERRLSAIVDTAMEGIVSFDGSGVILSANPAAREIFGYDSDETLGAHVSILMSESLRRAHDGYIDFLRIGEKKPFGARRRFEGRRKDGAVFPLEIALSETTLNGQRLFVGFMRDLSPIEEEKRRVDALLAELFHASRLNDMGEVVASLAHEIGQPIAAIQNFAAAYRLTLDQTGEPPRTDLVALIEAQGRRAAEILKRLRGFIAKRPPESRAAKIKDLIDDAIQLALLRSRTHVERRPLSADVADLSVYVDPILIGQVLVNLLRNADDALTETREPQIQVEATRAHPSLVRISVCDNGAGVDPQGVDQLFKPFYTSKPEGLGVGLSIGRTIVESYGGILTYRPNAPHGSIFEFILPICTGDEDISAPSP